MEISARELAAYCGGEIEGDPSVTVSDFAKIEEAGPGDLSFIANPKYAHHAASTHASVLLVSTGFEAPENIRPTLIRVADPYATLARLMSMVAEARPKPEGIENPVNVGEGTVLPSDIYLGAFAYIGKNVTLGEGVKIYPQVYVGEGCHIGADTILYPGVKIYAGCKVGARCIIHAGAVVGADGFGFAPVEGRYEKIPQMGSVVIEDDVEIGANTTIDRATFGATVIGRGTKLDNLIQIAHNVTLGEDNVIAAQAGVAGSTKIGNGNRIGGQVGFAGHIHIGNNNEIGAQSGLHTDVGDNCRLIGYPAMEARKFARNIVNLNRLAEFLSAKKEEKHEIK